VDACPTDALKFGEASELKDKIPRAETLKPAPGAKPRVYYIGLPNKYFVTGAVDDPQADECLESATVILTNMDPRKAASLQTDIFGDFWFEKQETGHYSLRIEKSGYASKTMDVIEVLKCESAGYLNQGSRSFANEYSGIIVQWLLFST